MTGTNEFIPQETSHASRSYVVPECTQAHFGASSAKHSAAAERCNVFERIDQLIESGRTRIVLEAPSGAGKTAFCLNFHAREQRRKPQRRRRVAIVPLAGLNQVSELNAIPRSQETILLLDGLDLNTVAPEEGSATVEKLMDTLTAFRAVIVTCCPRLEYAASQHAAYQEAQASPRFEIIRLLPFSDIQLKKFVRAQFSLLQFRQRAKAASIAAAIPSLRAQPALLAALPAILKARKPSSELYEIHAFFTNRWLEQQRGWIAPDLLAITCKRMAMAIWLKAARTPGKRLSAIAPAELGGIANMGLLQPGPASLISRDHQGNLVFTHNWIMEFFFVCAFIEGEASCASVEWTTGMRTLLLSWGRTNAAQQQPAQAKRILAMDLRPTGILPFCTARPPQMLGSPEELAADASRPEERARLMPAGWRSACLQTSLQEGVANILDLSCYLNWRIIRTNEMMSWDEIRLYRLSLGQISMAMAAPQENEEPAANPIPKGRLPSIDEFVLLWEAEAILGGRQVLDRREFYWLGDRLGRSRYLACSVGTEPMPHELLTAVANRKLTNAAQQETLFIYEVAMRASTTFENQLFKAQACTVEHFDADVWYSIGHDEEGIFPEQAVQA